MKPKKAKNKHRKRNNRYIGAIITVIGVITISTVICMAVILRKSNSWKKPEELLIEYMNYIPKQEYEQMYEMLHIEESGNISLEDFVKRNSAIYEGIEVQNMVVEIVAYDEKEKVVTYQTSFDTVAGSINFENKALRRRLLDMGITRGVVIEIKKIAPLGDPIDIYLRGYELCLRKADMEGIDIRVVK